MVRSPDRASAHHHLQTYTHDAWSNLVSRTGKYWSEDDIIEPQTYDAHNRNIAWSYDADGRLLSMNEPPYNELPYVPPAHTYDAAGNHAQVKQTTSKPSLTNPNVTLTTVTTNAAIYDGDGQQVKEAVTKQVNNGQPGVTTICYLRSSVLGKVITEYNAQGVRQKSYVYADGALIASTNLSGLQWRYNNPVTGDGLETDPQGKIYQVARLDPEGVDTSATDPADDHGEPLHRIRCRMPEHMPYTCRTASAVQIPV